MRGQAFWRYGWTLPLLLLTTGGCAGWSYRHDLAQAYQCCTSGNAAPQAEPERSQPPSPDETLPSSEASEALGTPEASGTPGESGTVASETKPNSQPSPTNAPTASATPHDCPECRAPRRLHSRAVTWSGFLSAVLTVPDEAEEAVSPNARFHPVPTHPVFHPPAEPHHPGPHHH